MAQYSSYFSANVFLSLLSPSSDFLVTSSDFPVITLDFGKIFYFKEMYTLSRQKMYSVYYSGSDFVQVNINEHIQTFIPFLDCGVTQLIFNDSYSQFKSLKVREEQVQPTENYGSLNTAKHHTRSRAA